MRMDYITGIISTQFRLITPGRLKILNDLWLVTNGDITSLSINFVTKSLKSRTVLVVLPNNFVTCDPGFGLKKLFFETPIPGP